MEDHIQAALATFDVGFGPMTPDEDIIRTGHVSIDAYISPERFEREREIFRKTWLNVAVDSELNNPGDWVVREVEAAPASILISRGTDGIIRAFHNVCSHRSLKLVWGEQGCDRQFVCRYHAWTYATDGSLRGVPDRQAFGDLDPAETALVQIACEVWKGLVFINLDPNPRQTLAEFLGGLTDLLEDAPLDKFRYTARMTGTVKANWKAGVDASSEGYHVQILHRETAGDMVCSKENPFLHFLSLDFFNANRQMSNPGNMEFQLPDSRPVSKLIFESIPQPVVKSGEGTGSFDIPGLNPANAPDWSNDLIAIFPNFQLNLALNGFWTMHYWPVTVDSMRWEARYHFTKAPSSWRERFALEGSVALNRDIATEDASCMEVLQTAMQARARPFARFGTNEFLCRHQAAVIDAIVNQKAPHLAAMAAE